MNCVWRNLLHAKIEEPADGLDRARRKYCPESRHRERVFAQSGVSHGNRFKQRTTTVSKRNRLKRFQIRTFQTNISMTDKRFKKGVQGALSRGSPDYCPWHHDISRRMFHGTPWHVPWDILFIPWDTTGRHGTFHWILYERPWPIANCINAVSGVVQMLLLRIPWDIPWNIPYYFPWDRKAYPMASHGKDKQCASLERAKGSRKKKDAVR